MQDLRLAFRSLRATPIVTVVAMVSLALGIGANTAIFSLVDHLLLRPLPVRAADRLALITAGAKISYKPNYSYAVFDVIREHPELFDDVLGVSNCCGQSLLTIGDSSELIDRLYVTGSYFQTLGVEAILGRVLTPEDDGLGAGPYGNAAVLSYGAWTRLYNGDPGVVGRGVRLNGEPATVVGVLPSGFAGTEVGRSCDLFLPARRVLASAPFDKHSTALDLIVRLKPLQTIASASAGLRAMQSEIRKTTRPPNESPAEYLKDPFSLEPASGGTSSGSSRLRERFDRPLFAVFALVAMVLLIAAANVANVQLARGLARRHELSVRLAIGASRWQLVRLLVIESALLAVAGGAGGVWFAEWASRLLIVHLSTSAKPIVLTSPIDWRVLAFTVLVMVLTTTVAGVVPAFRVSSVSPGDVLKARDGSGDAGSGLSNVAVITQVAVSFALVIAAGLLVRTFDHLRHAPLGFDPEHVLLATVVAPPTVPASDRIALYRDLVTAAANVAGADGAGGSTNAPIAGVLVGDFVVSQPGVSPATNASRIKQSDEVTSGMFGALGLRILAGRDFDDRDTPTSMRAIIVNEAFARRFARTTSPIGESFAVTFRGQDDFLLGTMTVVGVVGDAVYRSARAADEPTVYFPFTQRTAPPLTTNFYVAIRSVRETPQQLERRVNTALLGVNPDLRIKMQPMADEFLDALSPDRVVAELSGFFGGLALLLAGLGLYGMTSYAVARRRTEIGIRMALGSASAGIIRLVLSRVAWLVGAGVIVGATLSLWVATILSSQLYGVEPHDPLTFGAAVVILAGVTLSAAALPAHRASRVDPVRALRDI